MWISKEKYNGLLYRVKKAESDADFAQRRLQAILEPASLKGCVTMLGNGYIAVSVDTLNEISKESMDADERIKDLIAERDWYKIKYAELRFDGKMDPDHNYTVRKLDTPRAGAMQSYVLVKDGIDTDNIIDIPPLIDIYKECMDNDTKPA